MNGVPLDALALSEAVEEASRAAGGAEALLPLSQKSRRRKRRKRSASASVSAGTETEGEGEEENDDNVRDDCDDETASLWARRVLPLLPGAGCAARDPIADGRALARVYEGLLLAEKEEVEKKRKKR